MKKLGLIAFAMLAGLMSAPVWATPVPSGSPRTYVSVNGRDQGACQNPCLTFQYALSQTSVGGEVIAVESGNFGPVTITNSVTIEAAPGVYAGITPVGSGAGVTVNGGSSVVLRGLTIYGGGGDGIYFDSGAALHVENCVISGVSSTGIFADSSGSLFVTDTVIRNNGDGISIGVLAGTHVTLNRIRLEKNSDDGLLVGEALVSISNSVISGNGQNGIENRGEVNVEGCLIANNGSAGIDALTTGTVRVSNSTVTDNAGKGLYQNGGTLYSRQNNTVAGNSPDTSGTITPLPAI